MNTTARVRATGLALVGTLALAACGGGQQQATPAGGASAGAAGLSGEVVIDGSSTVQPLTSAASDLFVKDNSSVRVSVATSGTGGGFKKFCQGATDISNASRPIKPEEKAECAKAGVAFTELRVATDALTVVAAKDNTFLTCMKVEELNKLWEPAAENKVTTWNQVNSSWPTTKVELYGPGTDSGTFDYFTDEINGKEGASRADFNASEDDNVIVQGVAGSTSALGYFGYTYYEENAAKLKAIQIDGGKGCVTPSAETAGSGAYTPLSRPLFIYVKNAAYTGKPQVKAFVDFYVAKDDDIAKAAQFISLNPTQKAELVKAASAIK